MSASTNNWGQFTQSEISAVAPILIKQNVSLTTEQPHIGGERFLMSGNKVVLEAIDDNTGEKLIIKTSADKIGREEIEAERTAQRTLQEITFAYHPLLAPTERWCHKTKDRIVVATEYIEQSKPYLGLTLIEQFDHIIQAFNMLAGVHATTASHAKVIKNIFGVWSANDYLEKTHLFISTLNNETLPDTLLKVVSNIESELDSVEQYCGFLTHDDFALHNLRFRDNKIYLIDQSSLKFGNKHESWARFLNYMLLYNPKLELALLQYLGDNKAPEELVSLRLMRMYKLVELITYHDQAAKKSDGNIKQLSERRVLFWHEVLKCIMKNQVVPATLTESYIKDRDYLRDAEEIKRQQALQQLL